MPEILQPTNSIDSPLRVNSSANVAKSTLRCLRVLVVDDDPLIQAVLRGYLEKWNHEVTAVDSAAAALEQLAKGGIDVIMSDWVMPQVDGLEFAKLAKQLYPTTPFILVTGFAEKLISRVPRGVDLLLLKPVSFEDIGHGLESVMSEEGRS